MHWKGGKKREVKDSPWVASLNDWDGECNMGSNRGLKKKNQFVEEDNASI